MKLSIQNAMQKRINERIHKSIRKSKEQNTTDQRKTVYDAFDQTTCQKKYILLEKPSL